MTNKLKIPSKYSDKVTEQINLLNELGINVRFDKGNFKSSLCIFNNSETLIINKAQTNEQVLNLLSTTIDKHQTSQSISVPDSL